LTLEQVLECYNSASPAAPLLIQQGHYVVRVTCPAFVLPGRRARGPGECGVKYGRATSFAAIDKPLKELHALGTCLACGATARLERRAPRGPPRGVVRLGPPMGVCALQTTHAGASRSRVAALSKAYRQTKESVSLYNYLSSEIGVVPFDHPFPYTGWKTETMLVKPGSPFENLFSASKKVQLDFVSLKTLISSITSIISTKKRRREESSSEFPSSSRRID
jgi:hypothetical protein